MTDQHQSMTDHESRATDDSPGSGGADSSTDGTQPSTATASAADVASTDAGAPAAVDEPADAGGSAAATAEDATQLVGEELAIGYPAVEEPVVECERIDLPAGEVTALVGPNGSGKSTLLKALSRQLDPEAGTVSIDDTDVDSFGKKAFARKVGMLSQEHESPGSITVEELVYHGRYPHRGFFDPVDEDDASAVERAIDLAGVDHLRDAEVSSLSGGQKQLAWIAMSLAQETDVLLLDEPTTYLDLHHQLRVMEVVERLTTERDVTVGVVLHDIGQAARYADNLVALKDGTIYDWGPPDEVVTDDLLEEVFGVVATVGYGGNGPIIQPHHPVEE